MISELQSYPETITKYQVYHEVIFGKIYKKNVSPLSKDLNCLVSRTETGF